MKIKVEIDGDALLSASTIEVMFGIDRRRVYEWVTHRNRPQPVFRPGERKALFRAKDVHEFLKSRVLA